MFSRGHPQYPRHLQPLNILMFSPFHHILVSKFLPISTCRPQFWPIRWYPQRRTKLALFTRWRLIEHLWWNYHLYIWFMVSFVLLLIWFRFMVDISIVGIWFVVDISLIYLQSIVFIVFMDFLLTNQENHWYPLTSINIYQENLRYTFIIIHL